MTSEPKPTWEGQIEEGPRIRVMPRGVVQSEYVPGRWLALLGGPVRALGKAVDALAAKCESLQEEVDAWRTAAVRNGDSSPTPESLRAHLANRELEIKRRDDIIATLQKQATESEEKVNDALELLTGDDLGSDIAEQVGRILSRPKSA